jgi:hypothetical protein
MTIWYTYFVAICFILWQFGIVYGHLLYILSTFWYTVSKKSGNPWSGNAGFRFIGVGQISAINLRAQHGACDNPRKLQDFVTVQSKPKKSFACLPKRWRLVGRFIDDGSRTFYRKPQETAYV